MVSVSWRSGLLGYAGGAVHRRLVYGVEQLVIPHGG